MQVLGDRCFELVVLLVGEGDERDAFALERCRVVLGISIKELPLVVALDDTLVRGPEVAARVFA